MSEDQPKQPEVNDTESPIAPTEPGQPEKTASQRFVDQASGRQERRISERATRSELLQQWQRVQSFLRIQSIRALRTTIQILEGALQRLEAPTKPPRRTVPSPQSNRSRAAGMARPALTQPHEATVPPSPETTPLADTEVTEVASNVPFEQPASTSSRATPIRVRRSSSLRLGLERSQVWWNAALVKIRKLLPASINTISDRALTGVVASVLVLALWTTSSLLSGKSPQVAKVPSSQQAPANLTTPPELTAPETEQPVLTSPPPEVVESPPPVLNLTPEQSLIAAIQNQVAEVTDQYTDGLIQSIQANFRSSRLIVKVGADWYDLDRSSQDKLADEMLQRAKELDFSKLEVTDTTGTLLARSPVVGENMVIVQRS